MKKWDLRKLLVILFATAFFSTVLTVVFTVMAFKANPNFLKDVTVRLGESVAKGRDYQELAEEDVHGVQKVVISSTRGDLDFQSYEGSTIKVEYTGKVPEKMNGNLIHIRREKSNVVEIELENPPSKTNFAFVWDDSVKGLNFTDVSLRAKVYVPKNLASHLEVHSISGDIHLNEVTADQVSIYSTNGDLELQATNSKEVFIHMTNGDLNIEDSKAQVWNVENVRGDVTFALSQGLTYQFNLSSVHGSIVNNSNMVAPTNGKDVGQINAKTVSGDIHIEKFDDSNEDRE